MSQFLEQSLYLNLLIHYGYWEFGIYVKESLLFLPSEIFQANSVGKIGKCSQLKKKQSKSSESKVKICISLSSWGVKRWIDSDKSVNQVFVFYLKTVHQEYPWGECNPNIKLQNFSTYSTSGCLKECKAQHIEKRCGCLPFLLPGK